MVIGIWHSKNIDSAFNDHPDPEVQSAALLGLGRTYYEISEFAAALDALRRIPVDFPDSPYLPDTYFALAQVYEALERFSEAVVAYDNLSRFTTWCDRFLYL